MRALFLQEIKTFFRSPSSIFIFVIPLILLVGLGYFIPAAYIIPSTISVGIVGAVLLYFGGGLEEIKRTSFLKVMGTTKLNKFTTLVVKMSFAAIISMATVVWILGLGFIFTQYVDFLASDFGNMFAGGENIPGEVQWNDVTWIVLFYAAALSLCVTLALAFCFAAIAKSSLSFYLLTFGYIAALILFGGVIMPGFLLVGNDWFHWFYYLIPNYYSGNQLTAAFNSGLSQTVFKYVGALHGLLGDDLSSWILNEAKDFLNKHPDYVNFWDAMNTAANTPEGTWGTVDGGNQISKAPLWWSSYWISVLAAAAAHTLPSFLIDGLITLRTTALENNDYWIDDLFVFLYEMPDLYKNMVNTFVSILLPFKFNLDNFLNNIIKYGDLAIGLIDTGTLEIVQSLIASMEYSKAFDFTNVKSIIDVFMPYVWIEFLAGISAWKFEWVN